ncbi:MAG: hypothetical protein Q7S02_02600 [bacterium]|nr:hypothetical protein [bacterium]
MIVDVIPIKRLPDHLGVFTYRVPEALTPRISRGVYVRIPFRGQKVWGIVQRAPSTAKIRATAPLRDILSVCHEGARSDAEVDALERAAALYRTSIATVALHAVSVPPLRTRSSGSVVKQNGVRPRQAPERSESVTKNPLLRPGLTVAVWHDFTARDAALRTIARETTARGQSLLCCTPHRADIPALSRLFGTVAPVIVLDRVSARGSAWDAVVASRVSPVVLLGTRAAIWHAPQALGAIVIDHAESDDHVSWDADPKYDARTVGRWIAEMRRIPFILASPAPRVVDWARADYRLDLGTPPPFSHSVVDLQQHWRSGERGYLTTETRAAVDAALMSKRVAVVLHNRRGLAARITCADCSGTITCTECGVPYAEHPDGLRCRRCGHVIPAPTICPTCGSARLSSRGVGTVGIVNALAHAYPGVPIARVDRDTPEHPSADAQIIVGSERFLHTIAPGFTRAVGAVIVIDAARFVRTDEYRANERLFQALRNVFAWSHAWNAPCVVQAATPDLQAITAIGHPVSAFYRAELAEREALRYPPTTRLITCTMEAEHDLTLIQNHVKVERIDGPFLVRRGPRSGSTHTAIIRLRGDACDEDVVSVLSVIPRTIRATVDPVSITP